MPPQKNRQQTQRAGCGRCPPGPAAPGQQHRRENRCGKGQCNGCQHPHSRSLPSKYDTRIIPDSALRNNPGAAVCIFLHTSVHVFADSGHTIPVPQVQKEVSVMDKYQNQNQNQNGNQSNQNQNTRQNRNTKQNQNQNQQQNQNQR